VKNRERRERIAGRDIIKEIFRSRQGGGRTRKKSTLVIRDETEKKGTEGKGNGSVHNPKITINRERFRKKGGNWLVGRRSDINALQKKSWGEEGNIIWVYNR